MMRAMAFTLASCLSNLSKLGLAVAAVGKSLSSGEQEKWEDFPMIQRNAMEAVKLVKHVKAQKQVIEFSRGDKETLSCQAQGTEESRERKQRPAGKMAEKITCFNKAPQMFYLSWRKK